VKETTSMPLTQIDLAKQLLREHYFNSQRRDNNFLNFLTSAIELKLAIVVPAAINARLSSASCKPQVITKKPTNTKIATKTQVSKGIPLNF
jgi:hypothetical protein